MLFFLVVQNPISQRLVFSSQYCKKGILRKKHNKNAIAHTYICTRECEIKFV